MRRPKGTRAPPVKLRVPPDKVFGEGKSLPANKLPLVVEVASALIFEAERDRIKRDSNEIDCKGASKEVTKQLLDIYKSASVPTISELKVRQKVHDLWRLRKESMKSLGKGKAVTCRRRKKNWKTKKKFHEVAGELFDVADDQKVPDIEKSFLEAQRKPGRIGCIAGVDLVETENIEKSKRKEEEKAAKKRKDEERRARSEKEVDMLLKKVTPEDSEDDKAGKGEKDDEFRARIGQYKVREKRKRQEEAEAKIAETADRFKVSSEAVAHLSNDIKAAEGMITEENKELVTNTHKINRMRKKARLDKKDTFKNYKVQALMVDERIDENKVEVGVGVKGRKRFALVRQEDCAVIGYPGEKFLGHLVPEGGKGVQLASSLKDFLEKRDIDIDDLQAVFSDGCSKMAGHTHGFIAEFEKLLGRPLLHVHCLCHSLEAIFGHFFMKYAGPTTGPASWSGEEAQRLIGKVWDLPVTEFQPIPCPSLRSLMDNISEDTMKEFNHDTKYLIEMAKAVESGRLEERWAMQKAGKMTNARWQNTQSRILRAYMSTASPTEAQKRMAEFVIHVYTPSFLEIRQRNLLLEGPRHLLSIITRIASLCTEEEVEMLRPHVQFNGYFGQLDVVLASLLASSSKKERQKALKMITKLRKKERTKPRKTVRKVKTPIINLSATKLTEMVDLTRATSSPPILHKLSEDELQQFQDVPLSMDLPCTTIAVERAVKLTTESAPMASGAWVQDTVTWNRIAARERNPLRFKKNAWKC